MKIDRRTLAWIHNKEKWVKKFSPYWQERSNFVGVAENASLPDTDRPNIYSVRDKNGNRVNVTINKWTWGMEKWHHSTQLVGYMIDIVNFEIHDCNDCDKEKSVLKYFDPTELKEFLKTYGIEDDDLITEFVEYAIERCLFEQNRFHELSINNIAILGIKNYIKRRETIDG